MRNATRRESRRSFLYIAKLSYFSLSVFALQLSSAELPIIVHPESFAGPWEASVVNGRTYGHMLMVLHLETVQSENSERLARTFLEIAVGPPLPTVQSVNKRGAARDVLDEWGYTCSDTKGDCEFNGTRLSVKAFRGPDVAHDLELDVTFDASEGAWRGRFTHDKVTADVRLVRPHRGAGISADPLEGNWRDFAVESPYCLHARQKTDGELLMWIDSGGYSKNYYGTSFFGPGTGNDRHRVRFQTGEFHSNGPHFFDGAFSADGLRFAGYWDGTDRREHPRWSPAVQSVFVRTDAENCSLP